LNPQLRKEIRGLLPAALAALAIPVGVQLCLGHTHHVANDGIPIFALFVAFLAASSFGPEVSQGTLTSLLVQPLRRVNLWNYKLAVLAVGIILVSVPFALSTAHPERDWLLLLLPTLCAVGLTPWLTLLFRDGIVAAAVTLGTESAILLLGYQMFRWRLLTPDERQLSAERQTAVIVAAALLATAGWFAGRRVIQKWQPSSSHRWADWLLLNRPRSASSSRMPSAGGPTLSLVFKELRLQKHNLILIAVFCVPFVLILCRPDFAGDELSGWFKFYSFVLPVSIGAVSISGERQLGVLESQLMLPVSSGRQWAIKMSVCFGICLLGGMFLPWALLCLRTALSPAADHHWFKVFDYLTEVVISVVLAILCSAVARGTLRALIFGLSASFVSLVYYGWIVNGFIGSRLIENLAFRIDHTNPYLVNQYTLSAVALLSAALILRPAFKLFRHPMATVSVPLLVLQTTVLLTICRLSLVFVD
jgi:hypothetical protein